MSLAQERRDSRLRRSRRRGSLRLGAGIKKIEKCAFASCSSLKSVEIPGTVESVGEDAFRDCAGLEELQLGAGIKKIENSAFALCSSLKSVEIPGSVESVGEGAFSECSSLRRVVLPSTLVALARDAFDESVDLVADDDM